MVTTDNLLVALSTSFQTFILFSKSNIYFPSSQIALCTKCR